MSTQQNTVTILLYDDADVIPRKVSEKEIGQADTGRQAQLIIGFLCRSVPDRVVRKFCEMTDANYLKILQIGTSSQTDEHRQAASKVRSGHKLSEAQVHVIRSGKKGNRELGRKFGVSERTIRDVKRGVSYAWVTEVTDEDAFDQANPIRKGVYDANRN